MRLPSTLAVLGVLSVAAFGAEYKFSVQGDGGEVEVSVKTPAKAFRMPAWIPGDYDLLNYGRMVTAAAFFRDGHQVPALQGADVNLWTIEGGATSVKYSVKPSGGNFSPNLQVRGDEVFINGGGVFGYFEGHQSEKSTLTLPSDAVTALKKVGGAYVAKDYDQLIDSPIVYGPSLRVAVKDLHGRPHRVVAFGRNQNADVDGFLDVGLKVAEEAHRLFGELPYESYTFFLDFGGRGGGLEHMDGTRIGLSASARPAGAAGILFHEYFHCFNVKRIRSEVLGPFDYAKPAVTGTLWWLEGVTDYYASKLKARAGLTTPEQFLGEMGSTAAGVARGAYLKVSADEASKRVWEVHGSFGFGGASYYDKGAAIGLFLDLAILGQTHGKKSLDDVIRALYKETKPPKPGYKDSRIRELCVEFGGKAMGPLYDRAVMTSEALPWSEVLPSVGFVLEGRKLNRDPSASPAAAECSAEWP